MQVTNSAREVLKYLVSTTPYETYLRPAFESHTEGEKGAFAVGSMNYKIASTVVARLGVLAEHFGQIPEPTGARSVGNLSTPITNLGSRKVAIPIGSNPR